MLANRLRMSRMSGGVDPGDVPAGAVLFSASGDVLVNEATAETGYIYPATGLLVFRTAQDYGTVILPAGLTGNLLVVAGAGRGGSIVTDTNCANIRHGGRSGGGLQTPGYYSEGYVMPKASIVKVGARGADSVFGKKTFSAGLDGGNAYKNSSCSSGTDRPAGDIYTFLGYTYGGRHDRRTSVGSGITSTTYGKGGQPAQSAMYESSGGYGMQGIILFAFGDFSMNYNPETNTCS